MATSIVSPSSMSTPGMSQIDQAFGNIYSMFGGSSGNSNAFGTNLQTPTTMNNTNPSNITMYSQGVSNLGQAGSSLLGEGSNLVDTGMGVTSGGLNMSGDAYGTTQTSLNTLQPTIDYYNKLISGDPATTTAALAPTAANLSTIYSGAVNNASQGSPAGGYRAATLAGLPQAEAAQVGNAALGLQTTAAQGLQSAAGTQNTIAGTQGGIGSSVAGTGQQVAGTGTTLTSQGTQAIQQAVQDALAKLGLNAQTSGLSQFDQLMQGIGDVVNVGVKTCWIAEAIYGVDDGRTHLVRAYLNGPFKQTLFGRIVMALYLRFGQQVAAQVRKRAGLQRVFRPLFDRALISAVIWRMGWTRHSC